jgi:hypothetical protein
MSFFHPLQTLVTLNSVKWTWTGSHFSSNHNARKALVTALGHYCKEALSFTANMKKKTLLGDKLSRINNWVSVLSCPSSKTLRRTTLCLLGKWPSYNSTVTTITANSLTQSILPRRYVYSNSEYGEMRYKGPRVGGGRELYMRDPSELGSFMWHCSATKRIHVRQCSPVMAKSLLCLSTCSLNDRQPWPISQNIWILPPQLDPVHCHFYHTSNNCICLWWLRTHPQHIKVDVPPT